MTTKTGFDTLRYSLAAGLTFLKSLVVGTLILAAWLTPAFAATTNDIIIGQVSDESGDLIDLTRDYVAGARVYFDAINARGGIAGRKITLLTRDDRGDPQITTGLARELIEKERAQVLFGNVGDLTLSELIRSDLLRRSGVALFAPLSGIETASREVFFLRPTYEVEALRIIAWFRSSGMTRAAIVRGRGEAASRVAQAVTKSLDAAKMTLVTDLSIAEPGVDFDVVARKVAAAEPQFLLLLGDTLETGQFIKSFRPRAPGVFVVGLSNVNQQTLVELAGVSAAFGMMLTQVVPNPHSGVLPLTREHAMLLKKYRDEPASHVTLQGFIAAKMLCAILAAIPGPITRASIMEAMRARRNFDAGGFAIEFPQGSNRGSAFADLTLLRKDGTLAQ